MTKKTTDTINTIIFLIGIVGYIFIIPIQVAQTVISLMNSPYNIGIMAAGSILFTSYCVAVLLYILFWKLWVYITRDTTQNIILLLRLICPPRKKRSNHEKKKDDQHALYSLLQRYRPMPFVRVLHEMLPVRGLIEMNQIMFSNDYYKLPRHANNKIAILLLVQPILLQYQTQHFIEYDIKQTNGGQYPLPLKGQYILLAFCCAGTFFTTLRRCTPKKLEYYTKAVQSEFRIVIKEASK